MCEGCLSDRPAIALLNNTQGREVREFLQNPDLRPTSFAGHGDVIGDALTAVNWANDLCKMVHRTRRMDLQGRKAVALIVCSCAEAVLVNLKFDEVVPGKPCARCGLMLPSIRWVPGHLGGEYADEMPTMLGTRQALQDARGPAPIVPFPSN